MADRNISNVFGLTVPVFASGGEICSSLEPLLSSVKLLNVSLFLSNFVGTFLRNGGKQIYSLGAPFSESPDRGAGTPGWGDDAQLDGLLED